MTEITAETGVALEEKAVVTEMDIIDIDATETDEDMMMTTEKILTMMTADTENTEAPAAVIIIVVVLVADTIEENRPAIVITITEIGTATGMTAIEAWKEFTKILSIETKGVEAVAATQVEETLPVARCG